MIIVYESKTGFTKKYAEMLSAKTGLKLYRVKELSKININEEIIFSWLDENRKGARTQESPNIISKLFADPVQEERQSLMLKP